MGPRTSHLSHAPAHAPALTGSKVGLPVEAHNPLLLARHQDLVSNISLGPFTLAAQRWGRRGLLLSWEWKEIYSDQRET